MPLGFIDFYTDY